MGLWPIVFGRQLAIGYGQIPLSSRLSIADMLSGIEMKKLLLHFLFFLSALWGLGHVSLPIVITGILLVMALVAVLTLLSVALYLAEWVRHMNSTESRS